MRRFLLMLLSGTLSASACGVPQSVLDQQKRETETCYDALARENELKKEMETAVSTSEAAEKDALAAEELAKQKELAAAQAKAKRKAANMCPPGDTASAGSTQRKKT